MDKDREALERTLEQIVIPDEQRDSLTDLRRIEAKLLSLKETYTGEVLPEAKFRDVVEDFMFSSMRAVRILLNERSMHPTDCSRIHNMTVVVNEFEELRKEVSAISVRIAKRSKVEGATFILALSAILCTTAWGLYTIWSIPPEMRGDAFKTVVDTALRIKH